MKYFYKKVHFIANFMLRKENVMDFTEMAYNVWYTYFFGDKAGHYSQPYLFDSDCVIIGTGKHEFYRNLNEFSETLDAEIAERKDIHFQFKDFWCEQKQISSDVYLVYGGLFIWWEGNDKSILINMDSRFTMLFKNTDSGWKVVHVHQSLPNPEQKDGEYYPKSLSQKYQEEKEKVTTLSDLAQKDGLTDLINYRTFEKLYDTIPKNGSWFFIADLDHFKNINDSYGHMEGNRILKETAAILRCSVRSTDLVCRMGGDEFVFLCSNLHSPQEADQLLKRILHNIGELKLPGNHQVSLSIGGTRIRNDEPLNSIFTRADQALYEVKAEGRGNWKFK